MDARTDVRTKAWHRPIDPSAQHGPAPVPRSGQPLSGLVDFDEALDEPGTKHGLSLRLLRNAGHKTIEMSCPTKLI